MLAGLAASIASGIVGSYVVTKRIVFICGSIAHSVLGGIGIAVLLKQRLGIEWLSPMYGALAAAIISAFLIGWIHITYKQREDTVIGAIWAFGMAIGVIAISQTPGYTAELVHFLFGNILWAGARDISILLGLDGVIIIAALIAHRRLLLVCFDEQQAHLQGLPVRLLYFLLLSLVAITTVILVQVVGAILVIALLTLPAAIANTVTFRLSSMIFLAIALSALAMLGGIGASFLLNWPPGATIALAATLLYALSLVRKRKKSI
jgi:zinc transport system permease protein